MTNSEFVWTSILKDMYAFHSFLRNGQHTSSFLTRTQKDHVEVSDRERGLEASEAKMQGMQGMLQRRPPYSSEMSQPCDA